MLCYRCGSHVPTTTDTCPTCGLKFDAASRQAAGAARRRGLEGAPFKPGDVVAGRYAIQEVVGAGPMGFVFRAQDQEIDVELALKVVHPRLVQQPEERTQFSLSLRVGKKLNHPNLLRVYEEGLDGDRPFFTMQLLEGMTLRRMLEQRVARGQLFSLKDVEPLLAQMAAALDAAHRFGPHSDLKPENVIVLPDLLKVTDYGLGLAVPHLPFAQAQKGHRADVYIAPEYVSGGELDTRMDVYSLGVIMGELVTGLLPEEGVIPGLTMHHPDLPMSFEALYRRALNPNPLARPKTAGELHAEFANILSRQPAAVVTRQRAPLPAPGSPQAGGAKAPPRPPPPPPVPTGMLPIPEGLASPGVASPGVASPGVAAPRVPVPVEEEEPPPPDATQPLDAATLAAIMGSKLPPPPASSGNASQRLTEQALPFIAPPPPKAPPAAPEPPPAPRASGPAPRPSGAVPAHVRAAPRGEDRNGAPTGDASPAVSRDRNGAPALEPSPAASRDRNGAPALEPSPAASRDRHAAPTLDSAPAVSGARSAAPTLESSPAVSGARSGPRTLESSPAVSGARSGPRTLESAPAVSGARTGPRSLDASPTMSGARSGARRLDSPTMSGARSGVRGLDSPTMSGARSGVRAALPTQPVMRASKSKTRSVLGLVLLTVGGLILGGGGGYLVLRFVVPMLKPAPVPPGAPVTVPQAPAGQGGVEGTTSAPAGGASAVAAPVGGCPAGMRLVSGGAFKMGTAPDDSMSFLDERPLTSVQVPSFCVDEYEYPNQAGARPKVGVTWEEAQSLCEQAGKRLCTEEEWEKACKGPGNARFPYGNTYDADACNTETSQGMDRTLAASGSFARCRSAYGVVDMSGNVAEWTSTRFDAADFTHKGGAFDRQDYTSRCSARKNAAPTDHSDSVGFRCCAGVRP
ncbi:bifunctional serine/threonine-protein kinase/formylglycine-generating enzyme family protein [Myxococcus sp. RHSTA-1-4]|uniref:bifunctional serine/threonine-protein kinase/formylglycine-generating enzyme family protein n=1 Tax=Myxococcus sp. RHSTA-1-4 TaxID=2874601 RepID=UPI001CBCE60E|nr:bifunctional serine/threonine-protein kinase/formylglycine-generating enzyme family protein [Myxococcus sp. RHSTA-1-4]MBZ4418288.1 SUMF1/EgtB/PvdO family nonheme iron enzyme [Myxococcus sp. RHSTA-1-4]